MWYFCFSKILDVYILFQFSIALELPQNKCFISTPDYTSPIYSYGVTGLRRFSGASVDPKSVQEIKNPSAIVSDVERILSDDVKNDVKSVKNEQSSFVNKTNVEPPNPPPPVIIADKTSASVDDHESGIQFTFILTHFFKHLLICFTTHQTPGSIL